MLAESGLGRGLAKKRSATNSHGRVQRAPNLELIQNLSREISPKIDLRRSLIKHVPNLGLVQNPSSEISPPSDATPTEAAPIRGGPYKKPR